MIYVYQYSETLEAIDREIARLSKWKSATAPGKRGENTRYRLGLWTALRNEIQPKAEAETLPFDDRSRLAAVRPIVTDGAK